MPFFIMTGVVAPDADSSMSAATPSTPLLQHVRQVTSDFPGLGIVVDEQQIWGSRTRIKLTISGSETGLHALKDALRPAAFEVVDPYSLG